MKNIRFYEQNMKFYEIYEKIQKNTKKKKKYVFEKFDFSNNFPNRLIDF